MDEVGRSCARRQTSVVVPQPSLRFPLRILLSYIVAFTSPPACSLSLHTPPAYRPPPPPPPPPPPSGYRLEASEVEDLLRHVSLGEGLTASQFIASQVRGEEEEGGEVGGGPGGGGIQMGERGVCFGDVVQCVFGGRSASLSRCTRYRLEPTDTSAPPLTLARSSPPLSLPTLLPRCPQVDWRTFQANHRAEWMSCLRKAFEELGGGAGPGGALSLEALMAALNEKLPEEEVGGSRTAEGAAWVRRRGAGWGVLSDKPCVNPWFRFPHRPLSCPIRPPLNRSCVFITPFSMNGCTHIHTHACAPLYAHPTPQTNDFVCSLQTTAFTNILATHLLAPPPPSR